MPRCIMVDRMLNIMHTSFYIDILLRIDIFAGNEQLSSELAFDIRKFEEMQAVEAARLLEESVQIAVAGAQESASVDTAGTCKFGYWTDAVFTRYP